MGRITFLLGLTAVMVFTLGVNHSVAQLTPAFSANRTEGCAPLVVQFKDESTGNPISWRWDLGNGTLSFFQNPAATFFNPGTYSVKLVVSNGSRTDSVIKTQYITVYASPTVNFNASDTAGCFPLNVAFSDLSIPGDGSITSWLWDFGDGDTSALKNPAHIYTSQGNFNVSLQVQNSRGCIQSLTRLNHIKLTNGVKADFSVGISANCRPPTPINFSNLSSGTGQLSYQWTFGDGGTSTQANPTHTYTTAGAYRVKLIVRNNTGCVDSFEISNAVVIGTVDAAFSSPATICAGQGFQLLNNSTPAPTGASWSFGDNTFSNSISPIKVYALPGIYSIKLVSLFGSCVDSIIKPITVLPKPQSAFTGLNLSACKPPLTAQFSHQSTNAVAVKWLFGDGDSSTDANPLHIYRSFGLYDVTLISTNAAGCTDTLKKDDFVIIQQPQVSFINLPQEGCIPYTFTPTITINSPDSLISYSWNFGDGGTATGRSPSHTYTIAGTYSLTLVYTTATGCTDSVKVQNAIRVGEKPIVNFSASPRFACAFQQIKFNDLSTGVPGDRWFWEFGDGGTSTDRNPQYTYQDTGRFTVRLIVWNNGCSDTLTINDYMYIKPPVSKFIDSSGCSTKFRRWFIDRSIGATSWSWDFGDGNMSTIQNPNHTYAAPGSYLVTLTVSNDTCEHISTRQVVIISEQPFFDADTTTVCRGTAIQFTTNNSNAQNIISYQWDFGDGNTGSGRNPQHVYTKPGLYSVRLSITDLNGCKDTIVKDQYIWVFGPTADFRTITPSVCIDAPVQFADSSVSDGAHPIRQWIWDYGDGIIDTLTAGPFSHSYSKPGLLNVTLTVIDSIGCSDRQTRNGYLLISKPSPSFSSTDTLSCADKTIRFFNSSSANGPANYEWSFGNDSSSTAINPLTTYKFEGDYTIKLKVTDRYGCIDSITKPAYVKIRNPKAIFSISDSVATCPPLVVNFANQSQNYTRFEWDFGDGTRSSVGHPVHFYTYPGVYKAKLTVTSIGGCVDTLVKTITVRGPQGNFRYDKITGCEPTTIGFTGMTKDTVSFVWDFNDGTVIETGDSIISHIYTRRGEYLPKMILKDPGGCQVSIPGVDTVRIYGVDAKFGVSQQVVCDSGIVHFRDSSVANDLITGYRWDFGDGQISTLRNPSHFYRQPGIYPIQLTVRTRLGCTDTRQLDIPVRIVQSPIMGIRSDSGACVPAVAIFEGLNLRADTLAVSWNWDFGNSTQSTLQSPLPVSYLSAASYNVRLIGRNFLGCADTVDHVYTAFPLPVVEAGASQTICLNQATDLLGSGAIQYTWSPALSLSCTDCATPKAAPIQNTVYHVIGKNIYGCVAGDSVLISVQQPFEIAVGSGDTLCIGDRLQLAVSGADEFLWSPSAGLDNTRSAKPVANPTSSVVYQVIGRDNHGCFTDTGFVPVVVYPYPVAKAGDDKTVSIGSSVQLKAELSSDVNRIRWLPSSGLSCNNCGSPVAAPKQTTTYVIEVENEGGCVTKDDVQIFVFCDNSNLFVPNTFTPNGDGNNDVFYPRGKGLYTIKTLRVFNRWGEVVYEKTNFGANDASMGWDGTHKGKPALQDVYVYTIDVICENQLVMRYGGNVALIR
ncbi:MAG: PKD domain-containing protein [Chitinophagaceae bacterium]|nr:PKD domain-containing protein [Chitinophagaceae bacterium]